jgi:putative NADH-flavin reductase
MFGIPVQQRQLKTPWRAAIMQALMETLAVTPMRLFILGATGRTGQALLGQAKRRGHSVTAFVRSPEKLTEFRGRVVIRKGDPRSVDELQVALPGHDAVLSALGPPGLGRSTILSDAARATVRAMQTAGVRRLSVVSVGILFDDAGILAAILRRTLLRNIAKDSAEMERIVWSSSLDWTIARPPRLTNGPLAGNYVVADGRLPQGARLSMSRADVASWLLDEIERPAHVHRIVGLASINAASRQRIRGGLGRSVQHELMIRVDEGVGRDRRPSQPTMVTFVRRLPS